MTFTSKSVIAIEPLGEKLKRMRNEAKLSLEDLAQRTGVQQKYLLALEGGRYDNLPGDVYVRSFLKRYADVLQVSHARVYQLYDQERHVVRSGSSTSVKPPKALSEPHAPNWNRILQRSVIGLAAIGLLVYLGFKAHAIVTPPVLQVTSPSQDVVTKSLYITIQGQTQSESTVRINGEQVFLGQNGTFAEKIDLQPGLNVIKIAATKQRSKEQVVYRKIIVEGASTSGG